MANNIKISELIPKGAPLSTTDLLMISQETSDGFESNSITGAEIIESAQEGLQRTLVSGTSIKTINSTSLLGSGNINVQGNPRTLTSVNGSNLTGTTNQISASVLIPAGTLVSNNSIFINDLLTKTAGSTTSTGRIYINTSNSLTGATLICTAGAMTSTNYIQRVFRTYYFNGTHLLVYNPTSQLSTDVTAGTITLVAFNPAIDYYLIFAVQNSNTTPDNLGHTRVIVQIYD
jgi:hypothetical protein